MKYLVHAELLAYFIFPDFPITFHQDYSNKS